MSTKEQTHNGVNQDSLYPKDIVKKLNQFIVGQDRAKKAVAIAIRNRWRRLQTGDLKHEIQPKNILMVGPTGVGKTEIARRIAKIIDAPFIKIEATKFTEVGYVGRDVDSIIRDLLAISISSMKETAYKENQKQAEKNVEEIIIKQLQEAEEKDKDKTPPLSKSELIKKYRQGELDEDFIDIESRANIGVEIVTPAGMEEITSQISNWMQNMPTDKSRMTKMKIKDAKKSLMQEESNALLNEEQIRQEAIKHVEENGIVFIDEIDKVVKSSGQSEVSREGVQRDLLPLIEGTTVQTKYGSVNTEHILFIASGAFMGVSPSDMASELQGRLPIRVNLKALTTEDFKKILTTPKASLTKQYQALMKTEDIELKFTASGISQIAHIAFLKNEKNDNIGARQLHAVMEKCLENISYNAEKHRGKTVTIDKKFVEEELPTEKESQEELEKCIL